MADIFTLHLDDHHQARWLDPAGALVPGTLDEAAEAAGSRDVTVLLPGESVLLTETTLPPIRQAARRLQAARYALEEQLAARVDTLHFALAPKAPGATTTSVSVIDLARMRGIMDALADAGLNLVRIAPDVLALPTPEPGQWQVCAIGDRVLVRTGACSGFACEAPLWAVLAQAAHPGPERLIIQADNDVTCARLADIAVPGEPDIERRPAQSRDALVTALLAATPERLALNLRQGEFARSSAMQMWWQPFQATAALAVVWLVLALAARGVEAYQLNSRIDALHAQGVAAFRSAFPDVQNINDLRVQAEQQIRTLRGGGGSAGIFGLLQATAEVTAAMPGITVQTLQYRDGRLYLSMQGDDVQALEALRAGFARQPYVTFEVENADAAAGGVQIRASVSEAAA